MALRPVQAADASPQAACPLGRCDGSGWLVDDSNEARPCECREQRLRGAATRRMGTGIPRRYGGVSFERKPIVDVDPFVLRHVREYVHRIEQNVDAGRGLWFCGDIGTGKTSLAMLVSRAAQEAGQSVAIFPMTRLLAEIRDTYDHDSGTSYMDFFRRLCSVDLLHIDDLGTERRTDWVLEQLYSIINERWQDQRPVVVTTNITDLDELREQLGARTVSRLVEICGDPMFIMGPDLRMIAGG
jgi:DNA replication protein DnaC